ncbi:MAG: AAA-like domain-containing protein [Polyangiales bacterium]
MTRWFNIAGPCLPAEHYMIPPGRRVPEALELIEQGRWFSLVSGRQTGKTTCVRWIAEHLRAGGQQAALWVDLEAARETPEVAEAMRTILDCFERALSMPKSPVAPLGASVTDPLLTTPRTALTRYLEELAARVRTPLVLLLDEADCLVGPAMVSFLTQLRDLYMRRGDTSTPRSVVLIGVRTLRDYALSVEERRTVAWLGTSSPFNVTVENVGLAPFTEAEVGELLAQHTAETGQRFEPDATARVWGLSQGHPWLVNALADQATRRDVRDRAVAVTADAVERAKETLILERRSHIDSLAARLREARVRRVIDPMIAGASLAPDVLDEDLAYVRSLGLIRIQGGRCEIANAIYQEVIPRVLTYLPQLAIEQESARFLRPDGALDMSKLMAAWQEFWREDGHVAAQGFGYQESGPHLMLMAFLQRVINGGGRIAREYALGKDALDLLIEWRGARHAIEVKLRRHTTTEAKGVAQLGGYLDALGLSEGWLVIFDLRAGTAWDERLTTRTVTQDGRAIHIVGC